MYALIFQIKSLNHLTQVSISFKVLYLTGSTVILSIGLSQLLERCKCMTQEQELP